MLSILFGAPLSQHIGMLLPAVLVSVEYVGHRSHDDLLSAKSRQLLDRPKHKLQWKIASYELNANTVHIINENSNFDRNLF